MSLMSKERLAFVWERIYPHFIAMVITITLTKISFDILNSSKTDELVDGIVTLDSIIIGFIGAIIPVILGMKNESKLVKYVFEKDNDGLFKKYISETIGYGLFDVCVSLLVYARDLILNTYILNVISFLFVYTFLLFIISTYRSMSCMLRLIFSNDKKEHVHIANGLEQKQKEVLWNKMGK